jgi:hypothetical protein
MALDDSYSKSLLHFNGADASTTITDESGKSWSVAGNAQIDTAQSVFGGASLLLDGNADYVYTGDSADWDFGTDPFTIDLRIRWSTVTRSTLAAHYQGADDYWYFEKAAGNTLHFLNYSGGATVDFSGAFTPNADQWYHIALVRIDSSNSESAWKIFVDGTAITTLSLFAGAWNGAVETFSGDLNIGYLGLGTIGYVNGWIDEHRISKGIARWTTDFTPPIAQYGSDSTSRILTTNKGWI